MKIQTPRPAPNPSRFTYLFYTLLAISKGHVTQVAIAQHLGKSVHEFDHSLNVLYTKGYIDYTQDNWRKNVYSLTAKGLDYIEPIKRLEAEEEAEE